MRGAEEEDALCALQNIPVESWSSVRVAQRLTITSILVKMTCQIYHDPGTHIPP